MSNCVFCKYIQRVLLCKCTSDQYEPGQIIFRGSQWLLAGIYPQILLSSVDWGREQTNCANIFENFQKRQALQIDKGCKYFCVLESILSGVQQNPSREEKKDFLKTHHADRKVVVDDIVGHPITVPGQESAICIYIYHSFSSLGILGQQFKIILKQSGKS